jgi:hypothetical protein
LLAGLPSVVLGLPLRYLSLSWNSELSPSKVPLFLLRSLEHLEWNRIPRGGTRYSVQNHMLENPEFSLVEKIGQGFFGLVFEVSVLGLPMTLKTFGFSGVYLQSFQREVKLLSNSIIPMWCLCMESLTNRQDNRFN